jgi:elongation factor P--(R)-beta-lysine ligase
MPQRSPWWTPDIHADRQPFLRARRRVLAALRHYLEARDFAEVETAILQVSPGNEAHLHAFATELVTPGGVRQQLFLHTSPEFACKKLLAAGERRIFEFARVFRNRERGALHHPEFTMLEWYRAGESCEALMDDCTGFLAVAAAAAGTDRFSFRGRDADPLAVPERVTVGEAFRDYAGIDLLATLGDRAPDRDGLAAQALAAGIRLADNDSWSDIFSRVLVERIEPRIGNGRATFLTEYPSPEAALARPKPSDPRVAERFELFICGVELANGFGELTDPVEQRTRLEAEMAKKQRLYGERYPIDEDFLAALAGMPPSSGCALGFDRLVMLAARASRLEQVIWTPLP